MELQVQFEQRAAAQQAQHAQREVVQQARHAQREAALAAEVEALQAQRHEQPNFRSSSVAQDAVYYMLTNLM